MKNDQVLKQAIVLSGVVLSLVMTQGVWANEARNSRLGGPAVDSRVENRFDRNDNNRIDPREHRKMAQAWREKNDRNDDGEIDRRKHHWNKSQVNTPLEECKDANNNGVVGAGEADNCRYRHGHRYDKVAGETLPERLHDPRVNTRAEEHFDGNNNNRVDPIEHKKMQEAQETRSE